MSSRSYLTCFLPFFILGLIFTGIAVADDGNGKNQEIRKMEPDKAQCEEYIGKANGLMKKHQYEKAVLEFKDALVFNPFAADAYHGLGLCYKKQGDYDRAIKEFIIGLEYSNNIESMENLALIYKYKGKYEKARELFLQVLSENPNSREVITYLDEMEKIDSDIQNKKK
jgi:tetratricopeptide (TPR) repeat protein